MFEPDTTGATGGYLIFNLASALWPLALLVPAVLQELMVLVRHCRTAIDFRPTMVHSHHETSSG